MQVVSLHGIRKWNTYMNIPDDWRLPNPLSIITGSLFNTIHKHKFQMAKDLHVKK